jgi:hypothetical protein
MSAAILGRLHTSGGEVVAEEGAGERRIRVDERGRLSEQTTAGGTREGKRESGGEGGSDFLERRRRSLRMVRGEDGCEGSVHSVPRS